MELRTGFLSFCLSVVADHQRDNGLHGSRSCRRTGLGLGVALPLVAVWIADDVSVWSCIGTVGLFKYPDRLCDLRGVFVV